MPRNPIPNSKRVDWLESFPNGLDPIKSVPVTGINTEAVDWTRGTESVGTGVFCPVGAGVVTTVKAQAVSLTMERSCGSPLSE